MYNLIRCSTRRSKASFFQSFNGEAPARGPNPYPFILYTIFNIKGTLIIYKWHPPLIDDQLGTLHHFKLQQMHIVFHIARKFS